MEDDSSPFGLIHCFIDSNIFQYFNWDIAVLPALLIMILLIILSALMSGSEVAFFSIQQNQVNEMSSKDRKSNRIIQFLNVPEKLLGTILVANNLFNVAFIMTSYFVFRSLFDFKGNQEIEWFFQTVIITALLVLFGEVIPKTYASKHNI